MAKDKAIRILRNLMTSVSEENVNAKDSNGWAPIHYMAGFGDLEAISSLVSLGTNLDLYTTEAGESKPLTPLIVAIKSGEVAVVDLLLKLRASSVLKVDDLSPWMYAIRHNTLAPELTSALIHNGADLLQLKAIIAEYGVTMLTILEVQVELIEKVIFAVNGGAKEILEKYLGTFEDVQVVGTEGKEEKKEDAKEVASSVSNLLAGDEKIADSVVMGELPKELPDDFVSL